MVHSNAEETKHLYKLFLFSFLLMTVTYGYALTNFTVSIDNEMPVLSSFGMDFGRWGQNLILFHILGGHIPYYTLLLSLFIFALAAIRFTIIFRFKGISAYLFCGLFLTFPQLSYQLVFSIMAVIAALGVLLSIFCVEIFLLAIQKKKMLYKLALFAASATLLMFILSVYQAFIFLPITIYVILFFQNTYRNDFILKVALKHLLLFGLVNVFGVVLYLLSVKLFCPPLQDSGYLSSFLGGDSSNHFLNFLSIWMKNLIGGFYYGERTFIIATVLSLVLLTRFIIHKKLSAVRIITLFIMLLLPFIMSAFVTNGYNPPRLYLTSNLLFAFIIVFTIRELNIKHHKFTMISFAVVLMINIFLITNLFYSVHKIYKYDQKIAEKIDNSIITKYPTFESGEKLVYFYGYFPYEYHQNLRLEKSEIFGGSFYSWDNGNNYRIINFFKAADVAEYQMLNDAAQLNSVVDSIAAMPKWPDRNSVKMINNIVVVKLGDEKGGNLYFE